MMSKLPYTLYTCPCTKNATTAAEFDRGARLFPSAAPQADEDDDDEEEQPFNPKSPRAKFALYPLESLLFCNECHEIRCPRCYFEESSWYYCPTCLFDVQGSMVRQETNRCTRSCFQCPVCVAPLALQGFQSSSEQLSHSIDSTASHDPPPPKDDQCILACHYCMWSTLELGIVFDKPVNISGQLAKLDNRAPRIRLSKDESETSHQSTTAQPKDAPTDQYAQLVAFYKAQIADTAPLGQWSTSHSFGLDSPSQLTRLLSTYGIGGLKKQKGPLPIMREALSPSEGLQFDLSAAEDEEQAIIARMQRVGWSGIASTAQRSWQEGPPHDVRFAADLRPVATSLRSKRAKRCRQCHHIICRFDQKRQRNKYDMRSTALSFVPTISVRPLDVAAVDVHRLAPGKTVQLLLTFRNPMFDAVRVTLATPPRTPGRVATGVTVLCPQFGVGANTDAWEEALEKEVSEERKKSREALEGVGSQAVAGKVWERGRNWTSVIVEIVPGMMGKMEDGEVGQGRLDVGEEGDEALLEIPILVRMDYETDETTTSAISRGDATGRGKEGKVKREMIYWVVVGVGRIELGV